MHYFVPVRNMRKSEEWEKAVVPPESVLSKQSKKGNKFLNTYGCSNSKIDLKDVVRGCFKRTGYSGGT